MKNHVLNNNKHYYELNVADRNEFDVPLEFEVFGKIVKDIDGKDIQVFIKEDKARGVRRDSSFYHDGEWEVFEFDDSANETRFRTSSGISSLRKYDDKERLKERYMVDKNGDTLTSEKYEWKNGRLVRMVANGVVRKYTYGKTMRDTVKVEPTDEGFNYHSGYNGTVGKMPEEGSPEYEIFAMEPYGHVAWSDEEESESSEVYFAAKSYVSGNSGKPNILSRVTTSGCVSEEADMPRAQCLRYELEDIQQGIVPRNGQYGWSDFQLSLNFKCECNSFGKYQPSFIGKTVNEKIEIYQSVWRYINKDDYLYEFCWESADLQTTYYHEVKHIKNGRNKAKNIGNFALVITYDTKEECEKHAMEEVDKKVEKGKEKKKMIEKWNEWYKLEQDHKNPESPEKSKRGRHEYTCY